MKKDLIGKKIRGFRFTGYSTESSGLGWNQLMERCIDKIGTIIDYIPGNDSYTVEFGSTWDNIWNYPAKLIEQHLIEDEFVLPKRWCITTTKESNDIIVDYFNTNRYIKPDTTIGNYYCVDENGVHGWMHWEPKGKEGYTEITFEQFKKYVLKEEKTMKTIKVKKSDLKDIYDIACLAWKDKIRDIANRDVFSDTVLLKQSEIDEMFKAATTSQRPVLVDIFGEPKKEIDFDKIKTGSKVMIEYSGQHCSGIDKINMKKPVDVVFFKSHSYITGEGIFEKGGRICCTFHQDGKFALFAAGKNTDYITEVIEY